MMLRQYLPVLIFMGLATVLGLALFTIGWILGPRRGKYSGDGMAPAIPGHNAVLVLFGCVLALVGWIGLNSAGAILFTGGEPSGAALIGINTMLAASASALTAAFITKVRFGKPDASLTANGWVGGLVASSASYSATRSAPAFARGLAMFEWNPGTALWRENDPPTVVRGGRGPFRFRCRIIREYRYPAAAVR